MGGRSTGHSGRASADELGTMGGTTIHGVPGTLAVLAPTLNAVVKMFTPRIKALDAMWHGRPDA